MIFLNKFRFMNEDDHDHYLSLCGIYNTCTPDEYYPLGLFNPNFTRIFPIAHACCMLHLSHHTSYDHSKNFLGLASCSLADGSQQFEKHTAYSITPDYPVIQSKETQYKFRMIKD